MKTSTTHKQIYFWFGLLAVMAFIGGISSCGCEPKAPEPADGRIKTIMGRHDIPAGDGLKDLDGVSTSYHYDNERRLTELNIENGFGPQDYFFTYTTSNSKAPSVWTMTTPTASLDNLLVLSSDYATSVDFPFGWDLIFTYDAAGHKTKLQEVGNRVEDYTWDNNGNMTQKVVTYDGSNVGPTIIITSTYTYTDKKDLRIDGLDWYYGKRSTYLPASETTDGITKDYTYVFDQRARVTQVNFNGKTTVYTYFN